MEHVTRQRLPLNSPPTNAQEQELITKTARIDLVRRYLLHPQSWPHGIDWGSHWYTSNKPYWDNLAAKPGSAWDVANETVNNPPVNTPPVNISPVDTDRKTYMRDYMRRKRATASSS